MINDNDRRGIAKALNVSTYSTFGRVKIGAMITSRNGAGLGIGWNERRTHPRQYEANKRVGKQIQNPCLHAEMNAIISAENYAIYHDGPEPHTIYVARLCRNGKWANCKPCPACHSEIVRAGIKRVVYTTTTGVESYEIKDA